MDKTETTTGIHFAHNLLNTTCCGASTRAGNRDEWANSLTDDGQATTIYPVCVTCAACKESMADKNLA